MLDCSLVGTLVFSHQAFAKEKFQSDEPNTGVSARGMENICGFSANILLYPKKVRQTKTRLLRNTNRDRKSDGMTIHKDTNYHYERSY